MTAATRALYSFGIRPHFRWREFRLLVLVAITLAVGWTSLESFRNGQLELGEASLLVIYLAFVFAIHLAFVITGRRMDQVLFPTAALLGGISLLLMQRLPQDLVVQSVAGRDLGLAPLQLVWLIAGFLILAALAIFVRSDGWLRRYKYTWAAVGIGLLLLVFLFGEVTGGARLTLRIGPLSGQPSELLKVILVVFLAGYLAENRALLAESSTRVGPLQPAAAAVPAADDRHVGHRAGHRDRPARPGRGAALLPRCSSGSFTWPRGAPRTWSSGLLLFIGGSALLYLLFPHVQERIDIWINPFADPQGAGYQIIRALYAYGRGGIIGTGLGRGLPQVGTFRPSRRSTPTSSSPRWPRRWACSVRSRCWVCTRSSPQRGFRIAATAADDFRRSSQPG